jgi:hypothetical protein
MSAYLTHDMIRSMAPSVYATQPYHSMSDRYRFVPTSEVVDILGEQGFLPVRAEQSRSRIEGKESFTRHMLRFRRSTDLVTIGRDVGTEIPELVLVNSHDGTSCYQFSAGVYRVVCRNGMISRDSESRSELSVKHKGGDNFSRQIIDVTAEVTVGMDRVMGQVATFKQISLPAPMQHAFATAAAELRDNANIVPAQLLSGRRREDRPMTHDGPRDLWTTMNVVQENMMQGGIRGRNPETGKRSTTRPIKSVDADVRTNKALWLLAAEMAKLVS